VASGDTCDGGHPPVRRTTSTEASNGESKANNRSSVKRKETTSKTPLARESSAKKPDTGAWRSRSNVFELTLLFLRGVCLAVKVKLN